MKRAFLHGLGSSLVVGALGLLVSLSMEAIVLALLFMPVGVILIGAASRAPHDRSRLQAILGWLLGLLALGASGLALVGVVNLGAFLYRQGFIGGEDIGTALAALAVGLLLLGGLVYLVRVRRAAIASERIKRAAAKKDRWEHKARKQEAGRQREWWEVLEVDPKAGPDEIRRAYLHKVRMYHPDRLAGLAPELIQLSESRLLELNLAFERGKRSAMRNRG
jgi:hypothetical protein